MKDRILKMYRQTKVYLETAQSHDTTLESYEKAIKFGSAETKTAISILEKIKVEPHTPESKKALLGLPIEKIHLGSQAIVKPRFPGHLIAFHIHFTDRKGIGPAH